RLEPSLAARCQLDGIALVLEHVLENGRNQDLVVHDEDPLRRDREWRRHTRLPGDRRDPGRVGGGWRDVSHVLWERPPAPGSSARDARGAAAATCPSRWAPRRRR